MSCGVLYCKYGGYAQSHGGIIMSTSHNCTDGLMVTCQCPMSMQCLMQIRRLQNDAMHNSVIIMTASCKSNNDVLFVDVYM